mgnify:FL=1
MPDWDSAQYLKFGSQRTQPARDLAARLPAGNPREVLDVGCGPGNSTEVLAKRYPGARILGIDSSPEMVAAASHSHPDLEFRLCDAGRQLAQLDRQFDVVFSNACIQWIPDHPMLLRNLLGLLKKDGVLAVQVPMNHQEPVHRVIGEITARERWNKRIGKARIFHQLTPEGYFDLLAKLSPVFDIWQTTYFHRMRSHEDILEWYRGTGLRPYLAQLSDEERPDFEREILTELRRTYPKQENGEIIFRFPRLFFIAGR